VIKNKINSAMKNIKQKNIKSSKKPNESGAVSVEGHIKIFDPNTEEVFVNKRS
jgi:hypothetical protein